MIEAASKAFFHTLAQVGPIQRLASRYGMAPGRGFARRFVAGESIAETIPAVQALQAAGLAVTLDFLGESVATREEAEAATRAYLEVLDAIAASGIERHVSLKLTQLGLSVDRATCVDNLRRILTPAHAHNFTVCIDMENSPYTEETLLVLETVRSLGFTRVGTVLQSCLHRTPDDLRRLGAMGAGVRLVKGAYKEPASVAFQRKREVDDAFLALMRELLDHHEQPAIATHDPAMIAATTAYAQARGLARDRFEFQMLYGIRRDLQRDLVAQGYRVRVYVPFGQQWFPYFMRRLGERPANVGFVLRSLVAD